VIDFGRLVDRINMSLEVGDRPEARLASFADLLFGVVSHVVAMVD
jgi:hypothetical protein